MHQQKEKMHFFSRTYCSLQGALVINHAESRGRILGRNWDKSLSSYPPLFTVTSTNGFYLSPSLSKSGLKLVCNVNIVYGNLKSENSQDYAQKPQPNCTFMNSASVQNRIQFRSLSEKNNTTVKCKVMQYLDIIPPFMYLRRSLWLFRNPP